MTTKILSLAAMVVIYGSTMVSAVVADDLFARPGRGFISEKPAADWQQGILTGNGTLGALVMGNAYDESIFLSHSALYLPHPNNVNYINLATRLAEIRKLCLAGDFGAVGAQFDAAREESGFSEERDPFIGAGVLTVRQPPGQVARYQRAVDFMSAETSVSVADERGSFRRNVFASRPDGVIVLRLAGSGKQTAELSLGALTPGSEKEKQVVSEWVKSSEQGVRDGLLYFRSLFTASNPFNPNLGYEVVGKVLSKGGTRTESHDAITITDADEILVLIKIHPLPKASAADTALAAIQQELAALPTTYDALLAPQAQAQGELMGRVSLSLDAPPADRAKPTEQLNRDSQTLDAPLAKIERAFDAGRYNIICSTGVYPPNLQGLWSATWLAPWSGSFTTNGNLPCAVSFLLMGNTPELMPAYFRYYDERLPGFRENAKAFFGTRGFHVPAQLTLSPRETNFNAGYPHCFWYAGAAWACEFYYDYYRYTGDRKFLAERAYPLMKEAAAFYEDFLTVKDPNGKPVFVPSFSPENAPRGTKVATSINATMEIGAAKQLLRNATNAAKSLNLDADLQAKWTALAASLPDYEVGADGSFREWLWPGEIDNNGHRHASQLYPLYDERPAEIVDDPKLVTAVEHSVGERLKFHFTRASVMAFGIVQNGLAAEHVGNAELTQAAINFLAKGYWSTGMASFHNKGALFNMDISGGFPYLCASALVYADPGHVRFFPARPAQWQRGALKGVRLRGGIVVRELTWDGAQAKAVLVSDADQTIEIDGPARKTRSCVLRAGVETAIEL